MNDYVRRLVHAMASTVILVGLYVIACGIDPDTMRMGF